MTTLLILLAAPFMAQVDVTIANVATPSIHAGIGASGAALELVIGGYIIAFAVLLITGARLGQTHGYRRVFLAGIAVFTAASLLCGLAADPVMLIVSRLAQGAGAALMFPQALTGIQLLFRDAARTRAIGLYAIALSTGAVAGQILGGVLIATDPAGLGWRTIFFVNVPVGLAVLAAGARYLPADGRGDAREVDVRGVAALSVSVLAMVAPLVVGQSEGWPTWAWVCLAASVPAVAIFVATQRRTAARGGSPLINLHVVARPAVSWGLASVGAATGTYYALLFVFALYVQQGLGLGPLVSGLTLVSWVAAFGLAGQLVRRLPDERKALAGPAGCLVLAVAYALISATAFAGSHDEALLVVLLGMGGLGLGTQFNATIAHLANATPVRYAADISGVSTTIMQIAGAVAVAGFGAVYLSVASHPGPRLAAHAFAVTTAALAGTALVAMAASRMATRAGCGQVQGDQLEVRRSRLVH